MRKGTQVVHCCCLCLQEVADWDTLVQEAEQFSSSEPAAAGVATPGLDAVEPADIAELKKMHEDLHRHLTIQAGTWNIYTEFTQPSKECQHGKDIAHSRTSTAPRVP